MCNPMTKRDTWICAILIFVGFLCLCWLYGMAQSDETVKARKPTLDQQIALMDEVYSSAVERNYHEYGKEQR